MKDDFLDQVDTLAEQEQRSRSELIREALRTYMRRSKSTRTSRYVSDAEAIEDILNL